VLRGSDSCEEVPVPDVVSNSLTNVNPVTNGVQDPVQDPTAATGADRQVRDVVRLRIPAVGAYLSVLRSATAGLAARLDFTLEEIEDLRIAVDEACAILLVGAAPDADLECEFELHTDEIRVSVTVPTVNGAEPVRDSFAWTVLAALAGSVDSRVDADSRVSIDLQKRRAAADA
jgi:serine/threonine-protein kinase RsbW